MFGKKRKSKGASEVEVEMMQPLEEELNNGSNAKESLDETKSTSPKMPSEGMSDIDTKKLKKIMKKQKRISKRGRIRANEKAFVRAEELQKALEAEGYNPAEAKALSAYIPNRKAKRFGSALLRLDKLTLCLLGLIAVIIILFIMAFSQEKMGNFTINLDRLELYRKGISISTDGDFTDPTAKLEASAVQDATNTTLEDLPKDLDKIDGDHNGRNYVAYTYYVRNAGKEDVKYVANVSLENSTKEAEKAARVAIWKNGERTIFAAPESNGKNEKGTVAFQDDDVVCAFEEEDFKVGNVDKYTVAIWLEGEDPDCTDAIIGGSMQFAMNIDAIGTDDSSLVSKFVKDIKESVFGGNAIKTSGDDTPDYYHDKNNITWKTRRNQDRVPSGAKP